MSRRMQPSLAAFALCCAAALARSAPAEACSPPLPGLFLSIPATWGEPFPIDGVLVLRGHFIGGARSAGDSVSIEVRDRNGEIAEGTPRVILTRYVPSSGPPTVGYSWVLVVWQPAALLKPNEEYVATVAMKRDHEAETRELRFVTSGERVPDVEPPVLGDSAIAVDTEEALRHCCEPDYDDSCGTTRLCWTAALQEVARVATPVKVRPAALPRSQVRFTVIDDEGRSIHESPWAAREAFVADLTFHPDLPQWCFRVFAEHLATGTVVESERRCVERPAGLCFARVESGEGPSAWCRPETVPARPELPDVCGRRPPVGRPDRPADPEPPSGDPREPPGSPRHGCNSAPGEPWMALAAGVAFWIRQRPSARARG